MTVVPYPPKIDVTDSELRELLRKHTQGEVARMFGVSRAAVSKRVLASRLSEPRQSFDDMIPWVVNVRHQKDYAIRVLRLAGRRARGMRLDDRDDRYLNRAIAYLEAGGPEGWPEGAVFDYDYDLGFGFQRRAEGETLIRKPYPRGGYELRRAHARARAHAN